MVMRVGWGWMRGDDRCYSGEGVWSKGMAGAKGDSGVVAPRFGSSARAARASLSRFKALDSEVSI